MRPFYQNPMTADAPYLLKRIRRLVFPAHWHGEIEVCYAASGTVTLTVGGQCRKLGPGEWSVAGSAEVHSLDSSGSSEDAGFLVFEMGRELLGTGFDLLARRDFSRLTTSVTSSDPQWNEILAALYDLAAARPEGEEQAAAADFRARSLLCLFAARLLEATAGDRLSGRRLERVGDMLAIQKSLDYVEAHFAEKLTLEQAAQISGYEKTRFCQRFRQAVGVPFHHCLNARRVEAARQLLLSSDLPVGRVGELCGFPEAKTFSRVFRSFENMTPTEWRAGRAGDRAADGNEAQ